MELQFTRNVGDRFKKGEVRDYPKNTWEQIALNAKVPLEKFTRVVAQDVDDKRRMNAAPADAVMS